MKRTMSFSIVFTLTFLSYSCHNSDSSLTESEQELSNSNIIEPYDTVFYELEKTFVTGDFDGDGIIDTLFERNISQITGEEILRIPQKPDGDIYDNIDYMGEQQSMLMLIWNNKSKDTLFLAPGFGFYYLINLGDVNKNGKDVLAIVLADLGLGAIRICKVYSYCKSKPKENGWSLQHQFSIHTFLRDRSEDTSDSPMQGFLYKKNKRWFYYDYHESNDDLLENVQKPLVIDGCQSVVTKESYYE